VSVDDFDIRSAYSAGFCLTRCWDVLTAEDVREVGATRELRSLAKRVAAGDFAPLFDPATYGHLGLCLAEVICRGEPWPVELPGRRPSDAPSFHVARLQCPEPLPFSAYDVLLAALASDRVPEIVSAIRLVPVGGDRVRQLPLSGGVVVRAGENPVAAGVRLRSELKDTGDSRLPVQLRIFLNALSWGVFARLDQRRVSGGPGRRSELIEEPSVWTWPPIASTVPAVARMWLALVERLATDRSGVIVSRDTDGLAILASPTGGKIALADGRVVHALAWSEIDELLAPFDALDPFGDGRPFWDVKRRGSDVRAGAPDTPLHLLALGLKRYVLAAEGSHGFEVVGGTEHSLGGGVVDPPAMAGRDGERRHLWTYPVAEYALDRALAEGND
jgi:hypothetical protein